MTPQQPIVRTIVQSRSETRMTRYRFDVIDCPLLVSDLLDAISATCMRDRVALHLAFMIAHKAEKVMQQEG